MVDADGPGATPRRRASDPPPDRSDGIDPVTRRAADDTAVTGERRARVVDRLRRDEDRFRQLAERVRDVIVTVRADPTVRVEFIGPAVEELLGTTVEEVRADPTPVLALLRPPDGPAPWSPTCRPGPGEPVLASAEHRDGSTVWVESRTVVVDHPVDGRRVEGILRDVTAAKRAEERRREQHDAYAAFIARAAHELRGSLASVSTTAAALADHHDELDPTMLARIADQLAAGEARLRTLADRLLDLSTIETGSLRLDPTELDVVDLARAGIESFRWPAASDAADERPVVLHDDGPVLAVVDEIALRQILDNLLANAAVHGHGHIHVTVAATDGEVEVVVHDDGPGIARHLLGNLFEPFIRGAARGTGSGLGLPISRGLARAMGGDLVHEPGPLEPSADGPDGDPGVGLDVADEMSPARFVLRLPRVPPADPTDRG